MKSSKLYNGLVFGMDLKVCCVKFIYCAFCLMAWQYFFCILDGDLELQSYEGSLVTDLKIKCTFLFDHLPVCMWVSSPFDLLVGSCLESVHIYN